MSHPISDHSAPASVQPQLDAKAIRILARSIHRQLHAGGYSSAQVVDFASQILDLVRTQLRDDVGPGQPPLDELAAE